MKTLFTIALILASLSAYGETVTVMDSWRGMKSITSSNGTTATSMDLGGGMIALIVLVDNAGRRLLRLMKIRLYRRLRL